MENFAVFPEAGEANKSTEFNNLHRWSRDGDWWNVKTLLNEGAGIDKLNGRGETPLHLACQHLKCDVIRVLIDHEASTDIPRSKDGRTALHLACGLGTALPLHLVGEIIKRSGDVNLQDAFGDTALHFACRGCQSDVAVAKLLIERGADVDIVGVGGIRSVHVACAEKNIKMLMCLLANGASVNTAVNCLSTPLSVASIQRFGEGVDVLLNHGADWMSGKRFGEMPTGLVLKIDSSEFARLYADADGNTALHAASIKGDMTFANIALLQGHDVNRRNRLRLSPLDLAVLYGHPGMVDLLSENGAALNSVGVYGRSALHLAMDRLIETCPSTCQPAESIPDEWPRQRDAENRQTYLCSDKVAEAVGKFTAAFLKDRCRS